MPYLPIGEDGPYPERLRQQFEGVIRRFKTGGQWREMPEEFGAWSTVHNRFRQWRDAGVFEALLEGLIAEVAKRGEVDLFLVSIDSTTARAHHATTHPVSAETPVEGRLPGTLQGRADQQGSPGRRPQVPPAGVRADRGPGRGQPAVHPRAGKIRGRGPVGRLRTRPDAVAADKAYSSCGNRVHLRKRRIKAVIPEKEDQAANRKKKGSGGGRPVSHDANLYKERNTVERLINKLKAWRGIATRYDNPRTATSPDSTCAPR
ncbi:IS5 family transposase [Streptomyces sparsogenes]|uniref:IS5 family transposase n=1 Tax=Streptomyces sparsogenes TaxID=67365 RepID=UPI00384B0151